MIKPIPNLTEQTLDAFFILVKAKVGDFEDTRMLAQALHSFNPEVLTTDEIN